MIRTRLLVLVTAVVCMSCLSGCGTARGLKNMGTGLGRTALNLPQNLFHAANRTGKGITQGFMSGARNAMGMGPRVLSVPAQ